ncbi:23S rRNA pseudouridine955/2504/2580 synthase [Ruminococcaceae bacterium YRB3002]|nr:23S rRNA pseudouridine955/2504/2580 synthase [Ruminococcaceae bacterium YRB3002]
MRKFTVTEKLDNEHVVKACREAFPGLRSADLYRALKHKDIRIDGRKTSSDIAVRAGQVVEVWLPDAVFEKENSPGASPAKDNRPVYAKVYESDRLLIVNKRQGVAVHSGRNTGDINLIDAVRRDLRDPEADLCHRIDMNTGGLVMIAKDKEALEDAVALFRNNLVTKRYRALVMGVPQDGEPVICSDDTVMREVSAYLEKTPNGSVYIHDIKQDGDVSVISRYRVLNTYGDISDIEVELVTGRTHQIRAQFAHMGHPVVGDGLYGRARDNNALKAPDGSKIRYQQLFASTLILGKIPPDNCHHGLSGRRFSLNPEFGVKL